MSAQKEASTSTKLMWRTVRYTQRSNCVSERFAGCMLRRRCGGGRQRGYNRGYNRSEYQDIYIILHMDHGEERRMGQ